HVTGVQTCALPISAVHQSEPVIDRSPERNDMNALRATLMLLCMVSLAACVQAPPKPDDPAYAPVMPRTPIPQELNNGAIYQAGFETNLYEDRKANRVGDV